MVKYCTYCGYEQKTHSDRCPLVAGIPKGVAGFQPKNNDIEYNLNLERMSFLMTISNKGVGPENKTIRERLVYEQIAFQIRRIKSQQLYHSSKSDSFLGFFHRRKMTKLDKDVEKIKEFAKAWDFSISKLDQIIKSEKIMLSNYSGKEQIPIVRDSETHNLVYTPIE